MTRMTGPDCAVMCNLINTHTHIHTHPLSLSLSLYICFTLTDQASAIPSKFTAVANLVRGLLDRKISEDT